LTKFQSLSLGSSTAKIPEDRLAVLLGTANQGKIREFRTLLGPCFPELAFFGLGDLALQGQALEEPQESGRSFAQNAAIKAGSYARQSGYPALADDSGLEVLALGGEPGLRSARYGGPGLTDGQRADLLISNLSGKEDRRASFVSVIALALPGQDEILAWEGRLYGEIALSGKGQGGFGYDPIFYLPLKGKTLAELSPEEKNAISHRSEALRLMVSERDRVMAFLLKKNMAKDNNAEK
jgi:XTP/dITP diphosphohydrolase